MRFIVYKKQIKTIVRVRPRTNSGKSQRRPNVATTVSAGLRMTRLAERKLHSRIIGTPITIIILSCFNLPRQQHSYYSNDYFKILTSSDATTAIHKSFSLTTRASTHLILHSCNSSSRKEDAWTRNEVHWRISGGEKSHPVTDSLRENRRNPEKEKSMLKPKQIRY